jgi:hypothetical protein
MRVDEAIKKSKLKSDVKDTDSFVQESFKAVLQLHEEILWAKDERIISLKEENDFLKESLYAVQGVYDEDKTTIKLLQDQLSNTQQELEFVKRKYKMMWNKAVENYGRKK